MSNPVSGRDPSGQALAVPVEPASGLAPSGFDPSRAKATLRFLAELVVPALEDILDDDGSGVETANDPCDAEELCGSRWCRSGGCVVDKLRFARRVIELTNGDASDWGSVEGYIVWGNMLPAQGTPTRSAETTGSVGEADGGPVAESDAP